MNTIRSFTQQDLPAVLRIENLAFPHPWPEEAFLHFLCADSWVILRDEVLAGYIICHSVLDETTIVNFAIDPGFQRQGLGQALLEHALLQLGEQGVRYFYLDVRVSNAVARSLYQKHGFKRLGLRKGYYSHPDEDALVMVKTL